MAHSRARSRAITLVVVALAAAALSACAGIPTDPDGTLDRVSSGVLRVGASPDDGLVTVEGDEVSGPEAELVEEFATSIDARVEWTVGGEENLVFALTQGDLDLVIGGITDQTPWTDSAGVSRPYPGIPGSGDRAIVMLVPLGENRFLSELERFLDEEVGE